MAVTGVPRKTTQRQGSRFVKARGGNKISTGKNGGKNLGTATKCASKRAHPNVRAY